MDQTTIARFRDQLQRRAEALRAESAISAEGRSVVELDQASVGRLSRMDAMQVQAMALANEQRRQAELQRIAAALDRIERGTFGDCIACGEEIETRRLEIDPTIQRCIACARQG
ncbi:TraR/DksA family transcriptional regulator [Dongia deserti]|uniref:TraR/DksA family transcriptional regulator n=1 Tax=Dongia deserti TaxID=2268030 RepID=UPI000E64DBCA|nr:TraR/DksA C4-type zinc finger protein [Dongia deserti]